MTTKKLPDINFVGGDTQTIDASVCANKKPALLNRIVAELHISPSVNANGVPLLFKLGELKTEEGTDHAFFQFFLSEADTKSLRGKYIYQITLRDDAGNTEIFNGFMNIYQNLNTQITLSTML